MDYEKLVDNFKKYECTLLSTKEEIEVLLADNPKKSLDFQKLRFLSKCGHEAQGYFTNVKSKRTGVLCKECSKKVSVERQKNFIKDNRIRCLEIENEGYNYIKDVVKATFEIVKTNEGCLADCLIRPIDVETDKWLKVQIKTTQKKSPMNLYGFSLSGKVYPNCLIVCVCIDDKRMWILDGDTIPFLKSKLNIGAGKSKYSKYEVDETKMRDVFTESYTSKTLFSENECMIPISAQQKQEQVYRQIREKNTPFVYTYPEIEGLEYDFKIGETKFQEKVCCLAKPNWYSGALYTNNGRDKLRRFYKAYKKGENDFYWFWLKEGGIFYVIPETVLIEHGKVETTTSRPQLLLPLKENKQWYQEYRFCLNSLDIEKLKRLLNI